MKSCCNVPVLQILVARDAVLVDAEPHPAGIYSIRYTSPLGWHYGYKIRRDEPPREAHHQRYRLHMHKKGD